MVFTRWLFLLKSSNKDVWKGPKYSFAEAVNRMCSVEKCF